MYYPPQPPPQPDYRKLGGWLMFLNVVLIITLASAGYSMLSSLSALMMQMSLYQLFPAWYWAVMAAQSAGLVLVCVFALLRLHRRSLGGFRLFMMLYFGVGALGSLFSYLVLLLPGSGMQDLIRMIFSLLPYPQAEMQALMGAMDQMITSATILALVFTLILYVGGAVGTVFYLKRSKRVAVYFDANYVPPPPAYPPAGQPPYPGAYYYPPLPQAPYGQWAPPPQT